MYRRCFKDKRAWPCSFLIPSAVSFTSYFLFSAVWRRKSDFLAILDFMDIISSQKVTRLINLLLPRLEAGAAGTLGAIRAPWPTICSWRSAFWGPSGYVGRGHDECFVSNLGFLLASPLREALPPILVSFLPTPRVQGASFSAQHPRSLRGRGRLR